MYLVILNLNVVKIIEKNTMYEVAYIFSKYHLKIKTVKK